MSSFSSGLVSTLTNRYQGMNEGMQNEIMKWNLTPNDNIFVLIIISWVSKKLGTYR